jgi:hypothetical protein
MGVGGILDRPGLLAFRGDYVTSSSSNGTSTSSADGLLMVGLVAAWGVALVGDVGGICGISSPGASR